MRTHLIEAGSEVAELRPEIDLAAGRRAFVQSLGLGAAGTAVMGAAAASTFAEARAATVTDVDILTFALMLEYLEAEFYLHAYTGGGLPESDIGSNPGQVIGGKKVTFTTGSVKDYALELATDEKHHVEFLRAAIAATGTTPQPRPTIDLSNSFTTAAQAAGLVAPGQSFDAFANQTNFLLASYIFEDVGVTAYNGASGLIQNKDYLGAAAGILAVEAYHAGLIRSTLFTLGRSTETAAISELRAKLDGTYGTSKQDDFGVGTPDSNPRAVLSGPNGIAFSRTTQQVLNIVYGAQNVHQGLFFPNGLNGVIR